MRNYSFFELKKILEAGVEKYNRIEFIKDDPIQVPHLFSNYNDIEISAFLASTIAWGQRKTIISNAYKLVGLMNNQPYNFIMNMTSRKMNAFQSYKHRTFMSDDLIYFLISLDNIYKNHRGLKNVFLKGYNKQHSISDALKYFRTVFFEVPGFGRTSKHISDITKGASAKRLNLFLRWMVRHDNVGVDFGIWPEFYPADLYLPLDVHTGNTARKFGLLTRKQNDWKAVEEVTFKLRKFDPTDPVKYDFALFGMGSEKGFLSDKEL